MKQKFNNYQGELKIFVTINGRGNEDYTFNRLTPKQKELTEIYLKKLNYFTTEISDVTEELKEDIADGLREKGHSEIEVKIMGMMESKKGKEEVIIYKNPLR